MSFCAKCGAYVPMGETVCPACGYDPEAEQKKAAEEAARAEAERVREQERQRSEEAERTAEKQRAEAERRARESAERAKQQAKEWAERAKEQLHNASQQSGQWTAPWSTGSATQSQNAPYGSGSSSSQSGSYTQTGSYSQKTGSYSQQTGGRPYRQSTARGSRLSVLSYFGFLFLVPLFLNHDDPFARFHANQGLLLFLFEAAVNLAAKAFPLGGLIFSAGSLVSILCMIRGVRSVLAGRMDELPIIGRWRLIR